MTETRYSTLWRNKHLNDADDMAEMIKVFEDAAQEFREMMCAGVELERLSEDYYLLYTYDPEVAHKFGFEPEDDDEDDEEDEVSDTDLEDAQEDDGYGTIVYGGEG